MAQAVLLLSLLSVDGAVSAAEIEGKIAIAGSALPKAHRIVIYLEPLEGEPKLSAPREGLIIHQKDARFTPAFLVVAAGESVEMPNTDVILHNVFSFSTPNDFDLGLYPAGDSRTVKFRYPGVVRIYCSIHEEMNATVFVAPSHHFAVAAATGEFRLQDVPPGRYRIRSWSRRLPRASTEVLVSEADVTGVALVISSQIASE